MKPSGTGSGRAAAPTGKPPSGGPRSSSTFAYVPESIQQVVLIQELQERVAELEQALQRERDRSKLLQSDLARLRQQQRASGAGSSAGSSPRHISPARLRSLEAPAGDASPFAHAAGGAAPGDASPAGGPLARAGSATPHGDAAVVSRHALELLCLKERAMDAAKEGIVIADCSLPDMPLIYANEGFSRMTGYSRDDVLGRNCRFLQRPPADGGAPAGAPAGGAGADGEAVQTLRESIAAGLPCVVQLMNYKRNGDPFVNYLSLNPVHDGAGRLTHYVGVQSDVTELVQHRRAELAAKHAALQASAATEAKSQFLARMSHEIRTPLNGMIAVGQLLADTPLSPAQWDLVSTIRCSGETLLTLITDILDFSRIEANKMVLSCAEYRLQTVVEAAMEIAGLHAAQKRLQVAYSIAPSVPSAVVGDAQRLQQILLNILNNSVKFTEWGEILLEVWAEDEDRGSGGSGGGGEPGAGAAPRHPGGFAAAAEGEGGGAPGPRTMLLQFSVRDTGIGIRPDHIGRLFQSFSQVDASPTRRHGGSGLGLAICQRLCAAMGGRMWAESAGVGEGALFRWNIRVRLPEAARSRGGPAGLGSAGTTPSSSGRCSLERGASAPSSARSSVDVACGSGGPPTPLSLSGRSASGPLYDLGGRRVLLVEPCAIVRQVLALALRRWGCFVCAVATEAEGAARLRLAGAAGAAGAPPLSSLPAPASPPDGAEAAGAAAGAQQPRRGGSSKASRRRHLQLEHAGQWLDYEFQAAGPYDVVILDVQHLSLLGALMTHAHASEAQRVVFTGWPGQNEPEDRADSGVLGDGGSSAGSQGGAPYSQDGGMPDMRGAGLAAQPPRALAERLALQQSTPGQRPLGYVVVTRPVRQGRLRLALEEVLSMQLDGEGEGGGGAGGGAPQPAAGGGELPAGAPASPGRQRRGGGGPPPPPDLPSPAALLGLVCSDPASGDDASSLGSRASSSSNLRCATGLRTAPSLGALQQLDTPGGGGAPLRLLLAEDNAINMKVALGILRRMGVTNVVTAEDGVAALAALHAAGGPDAFDVILMDLHMPRKGGMEAVRDIRRTWAGHSCKIIAVTADAFEDTRDTCIANGFDGWLAKPFRVEEFARVMAACRSGAALTPSRKPL